MTPRLTDLIAKAAQAAQQKEALKAAEKKAKQSIATHEREEAESEAEAIRIVLDWQTTALVLVFDAWECRCGRRGRAPQGVFFYQEHTRLANSTRLVPPRNESEIDQNLPRMLKDETRIVSMCQRCSPSLGFLRPVSPRVPMAEKRATFRLPGEFVKDWLTKRDPSYVSPDKGQLKGDSNGPDV